MSKFLKLVSGSKIAPNSTGLLLISNKLSLNLSEISSLNSEIYSKYFEPAGNSLIGGVVDLNIGSDGGATLKDKASEQSSIIAAQGISLHLFAASTAFKSVPSLTPKHKAIGKWSTLSSKPLKSTHQSSTTNFISVSQPALVAHHDFTLNNPKTLVTILDKEPHSLHSSLSHHYPTASQLGLVAAPTIFTTGLETTLLYNGEVLENGAVGLGITNSENSVKFDESRMYSLAPPLKITKCRGNIILECDSAPASRILVSLVHADPRAGGGTDLFVRITRAGTSAVLSVSGGDVGRGALAVDTESDLEVGDSCEFMRVSTVDKLESGGLKFGVIHDEDAAEDNYESGTFAGSIGGVIYGGPNVFGGFQVAGKQSITVGIIDGKH